MNNLAKPILLGALIIALGIFLGALRIAYEVSFEGKWDSCVKTFSSEKIQKLFNSKSILPAEQFAITMCITKGKADEP